MAIKNQELPTETTQLATFFVGDLFFGINVMQVQEIIRYQEMTPVPLSSSIVEGLINLRGQIITAIDLRKRLRLSQGNGEQKPMNVVVGVNEEVVSLLVDQIGDVVEVSQSQYEEAPDTLDPISRSVVSGVFKLDGSLLLLLDVEAAVKEEMFDSHLDKSHAHFQEALGGLASEALR
ncbi:chemotaxis protein CheW [bacterium]|jgi:purine-binding chemotaxis protein CheW|nr:chemotaxis protein CheW [bacterium]